MGPPRQREPSISYTQEYNEFIAKLTTYHQKRGTHFDPEPRVGTKHVDLLTLFNTVVSRGGYDKVSEEKLAWRKLGQDFNLGTNNLPALAFSLKTAYYRYLAAYEISTVHGKEPPPKEILEDVTAKGGSLLTRTVENYRPSGRREPGALTADQSDGSGDDGTPVRERNDSEDAPGSGGRATRGLRQAPPQRVLFQPDTLPSRQTRHAAPQAAASPLQAPRGASTFHNPSNPDNLSQIVANYEPRPQLPLTLRPVITPGNNASEFQRRQRILREQMVAANGKTQSQRIMLPGTGFDGPNIYVRCLLALKSGIPAEQDYALHHLVKISMERGDKYRFEAFPGLAEALVEKVLEVSSLFYHVNWGISYLNDGRIKSPHTLDGVEGTPDILQKIMKLVKRENVDDNLNPALFSDTLLQINEAALTLRNMVMLEENAQYVSELHPLREFLSIALNLPNLESVVELKHYALDIAEQLTKYLHLDPDDPLYLSLLAQLRSSDRGAILTSLHAISRISLNLDVNNRLNGVPADFVKSIIDWTLLDDEELVSACLDFLYQYSATADNIDVMIAKTYLGPLVNQLIRLLLHGSRSSERDYTSKRESRRPAPTEIPVLPQDLLNLLLKLEEPERSSQWLRCLFEEDKDESITQIALWQAYQARFASAVQDTGRPLLPAADFIKNVSTTFAEKATAQVQSGPVQRFIIKGIRIRGAPVDLNGREYAKCLWSAMDGFAAGTHECGEFFIGPEQMYDHILMSHISALKNDDGKFKNEKKNFVCSWRGCRKYTLQTPLRLAEFAAHIKIHVNAQAFTHTTLSAREISSHVHSDGPQSKKFKPSWNEPQVKIVFKFFETPVDERGDAAGIPLTAVLVLRNLARNLPKTEAEENAIKSGDTVSYVDRFFKPVERKLWDVFMHNKSLVSYFP
jgi:chromatin structure-remodeling complex subunit RSC9